MKRASANPGVQAGDKRALLVYKLRLRDKHATELNRQARAVNLVWNYANETQQKAARALRRWLGYSDLARLTAGAGQELDLHSHTVQRVCAEYDKSRRQQRKPWLRWRGRKSLGWVPFNTGHVAFDGVGFTFRGTRYETMHLRDMPAGIAIRAGSFNADSRGRWYINVPVEVEIEAEASALPAVGIDLGLKTLAALSNGEKIEAPLLYRTSEIQLATSQRARKTKRARAIHAKVANRRKDFLHKASNRLANEFGLIVIGDVSPAKMVKTTMAKSTLDAGWSGFKNMLAYKALRHGAIFLEVDEANTTQTCSTCGTKPSSRPKGIAGLGIRDWTCSDCGTAHDRDVNAARNILRVGLHALAEGASGSVGGNLRLQAEE